MIYNRPKDSRLYPINEINFAQDLLRKHASQTTQYSRANRTTSLLAGTSPCSHVFIAASACFCTARTVLSICAFFVLKSEQWKPSDTPIGWVEVLATLVPSADTVASLHGSPEDSDCQQVAMIRMSVPLTLTIGEEKVFHLHIPSLVR